MLDAVWPAACLPSVFSFNTLKTETKQQDRWALLSTCSPGDPPDNEQLSSKQRPPAEAHTLMNQLFPQWAKHTPASCTVGNGGKE